MWQDDVADVHAQRSLPTRGGGMGKKHKLDHSCMNYIQIKRGNEIEKLTTAYMPGGQPVRLKARSVWIDEPRATTYVGSFPQPDGIVRERCHQASSRPQTHRGILQYCSRRQVRSQMRKGLEPCWEKGGREEGRHWRRTSVGSAFVMWGS